MAEKHIDLHVVDGDFVFDAGNAPEPVSDRYSIGQDIKHRLIESGLVRLLVAERDPVEQGTLKNKMIIEAEKDTRLRPGTVSIDDVENKPGEFYLTARTLEYGDVFLNF